MLGAAVFLICYIMIQKARSKKQEARVGCDKNSEDRQSKEIPVNERKAKV